MLIRELPVDLPGDVPATHATHERDDRANAVYEQLCAGDAGMIADDIATIVRRAQVASDTVAADDHR